MQSFTAPKHQSFPVMLPSRRATRSKWTRLPCHLLLRPPSDIGYNITPAYIVRIYQPPHASLAIPISLPTRPIKPYPRPKISPLKSLLMVFVSLFICLSSTRRAHVILLILPIRSLYLDHCRLVDTSLRLTQSSCKLRPHSGLRLLFYYMAAPTTIRTLSRSKRVGPVVNAISRRAYGPGTAWTFLWFAFHVIYACCQSESTLDSRVSLLRNSNTPGAPPLQWLSLGASIPLMLSDRTCAYHGNGPQATFPGPTFILQSLLQPKSTLQPQAGATPVAFLFVNARSGVRLDRSSFASDAVNAP